MDRVLLRKLTRKSTLRFGKHYDLTVEQVLTIDLIAGMKYLRWVYYSCSNITFADELLDYLGIHEKIRISKPSKVSESKFLEYLKEIEYKEISDLDSSNSRKLRSATKKNRKIRLKVKTNMYCSKYRLMRKNQGK